MTKKCYPRRQMRFAYLGPPASRLTTPCLQLTVSVITVRRGRSPSDRSSRAHNDRARVSAPGPQARSLAASDVGAGDGVQHRAQFVLRLLQRSRAELAAPRDGIHVPRLELPHIVAKIALVGNRLTRFASVPTRFASRLTRFASRPTRFASHATRFAGRATRFLSRATRFGSHPALVERYATRVGGAAVSSAQARRPTYRSNRESSRAARRRSRAERRASGCPLRSRSSSACSREYRPVPRRRGAIAAAAS